MVGAGDLVAVQAPGTTGNVGMRIIQGSIDRILDPRIDSAWKHAQRGWRNRNAGRNPETA